MLINYKRFDKSQRTISFVFKRLTEIVFEHIEEIIDKMEKRITEINKILAED